MAGVADGLGSWGFCAWARWGGRSCALAREAARCLPRRSFSCRAFASHIHTRTLGKGESMEPGFSPWNGMQESMEPESMARSPWNGVHGTESMEREAGVHGTGSPWNGMQESMEREAGVHGTACRSPYNFHVLRALDAPSHMQSVITVAFAHPPSACHGPQTQEAYPYSSVGIMAVRHKEHAA
jgi:hypothetical protein